MKILVVNIGSTSFKFRLFDVETRAVLAQGRLERIGQPGGECADYGSAIRRCLHSIVGPEKPLARLSELSAVGFKAVHAGETTGARLVNDDILKAMEEVNFLAPAHNPPYVAALRAFAEVAPGVPLVALFETAFFTSMSEAARTYAVPHAWQEELGFRRYGFHGASHRYAAERVLQLCERPRVRHVSCHLGGSSSVAAICDGVGVNSSFGMSPQSGLPHHNRVGDLDAFALLYVMKRKNLGVDETARILCQESGLVGISGLSGDVRDLVKAAAAGHHRARLALDVLVRAVRRYLGAFMVELAGLDAVSFSGGIGENSPDIRAAVCQGLEHIGIQLDAARNLAVAGEGRISTETSAVQVWVIPADEEWVVARAAADLISTIQPQSTPQVGAANRASRGDWLERDRTDNSLIEETDDESASHRND